MSETPLRRQSVNVVQAHPAGGPTLQVPCYVRGIGIIEIPADGEEHVIRYDGLNLYVDGERVPMGGA